MGSLDSGKIRVTLSKIADLTPRLRLLYLLLLLPQVSCLQQISESWLSTSLCYLTFWWDWCCWYYYLLPSCPCTSFCLSCLVFPYRMLIFLFHRLLICPMNFICLLFTVLMSSLVTPTILLSRTTCPLTPVSIFLIIKCLHK